LKENLRQDLLLSSTSLWKELEGEARERAILLAIGVLTSTPPLSGRTIAAALSVLSVEMEVRIGLLDGGVDKVSKEGSAASLVSKVRGLGLGLGLGLGFGLGLVSKVRGGRARIN